MAARLPRSAAAAASTAVAAQAPLGRLLAAAAAGAAGARGSTAGRLGTPPAAAASPRAGLATAPTATAAAAAAAVASSTAPTATACRGLRRRASRRCRGGGAPGGGSGSGGGAPAAAPRRACRNVAVQAGVRAATAVGRSRVAGYGLFTTAAIRQGEYVGEYAGEVLGVAAANSRDSRYAALGTSYLFSLGDGREIDATLAGNKTRMINHAPEEEASLAVRAVAVRGEPRIALTARVAAPRGTELFFYYGKSYDERLRGVGGGSPSAAEDEEE